MKKQWLLLLLGIAARAQNPPPAFHFDFGSGEPAPGHVKVRPDTRYTEQLGYGWEDSNGRAVNRGDKPPFYFSVKVPEEGNYKVTVTFGDAEAESVATVKAELRRLMVEKVMTAPGHFETRTFLVNVRRPQIPGGLTVKMRESEAQWETRAWDDKLTLEFANSRPATGAVEIEKSGPLPTLFLIGDSASADLWQEPYCTWGQMLPRFFLPEIAIANHGESAETLREFMAENRLAKVVSAVKPGDYVFVQMGANDRKEEGPPGIGPFTSFKTDLKHYVAEIRGHGAAPVLITSSQRLIFAGKQFSDTLGDYPEAVRQVAREESVPLIDLAAMSRILFEAIGPGEIAKASADTSHTNNYGAYELAKCIVEGIRKAQLPIARYLVDLPPFDPAHPDPAAKFDLPAEPFVKVANPY